MGKFFKKFLAFTLAAFLFLTSMPLQSVYAEDLSSYTIEKVDGNDYGVASLKDKIKAETFLDVFDGDPRETISVIVELEDAPVIEKELKGISTYALRSETYRLESKQDQVINKIHDIDDSSVVNDRFTYLANSVAVDIKAESFDSVRALAGVKRVFVEREYYTPTPQMTTSNGIVNAVNTWNTLGYKGEGMTVAVLDTGLDTDHPAFNVNPDSPKYDVNDIVTKLEAAGDNVHANVSDYTELYNNEKVPFTYDYAMDKVSVKPDASNAGKISHGTHVAGTVAGKDSATFKGVAPEAQLLIFKVFNNEAGGATDSVIMAALEDAVILGVDSINMSLGSDGGFTSEADDYTDDLYARIREAGILVSASAGNAHSNAVKNTWQLDNTLASDPDHGIVGSPSTYTGPLSIASSENIQMVTSVIKVDGEDYTYVDTENSIQQIVGEHDFVFVPNFGEEADYAGLDVRDKVVFVSRGEISFPEKMNFAKEEGAVGIIIYGTDDSLINMSTEGATLPAAYIIKSYADAIKATGVTVVDVSDEEVIQANPNAHLPSDFSSMGTTNDLSIKPELTAPGGQIYSALPSQGGNNFGMMSGTSMAAPHVAGGAALVKQFIKDKYPTLTDAEVLALMDNLLMSTANVLRYNDEENVVRTAPVRQQGSGVMDLEKAIKANAYLSVDATQNNDGSTRPKLELKDNETGTYSVSFKVTNMSDTAQSYDISTTMTAPDAYGVNYGPAVGVKVLMEDFNNDLSHTSTAPTSVTVAPHTTETVSFTLQVDADEIADYSEAFVNGFYAEGFVELSNQDTTGIDLNIPFLGFVGDWSKAPIFDRANDSDIEGDIESLVAHVLASNLGEHLVNLGLSAFHENMQEAGVDYSRLVVSPTGDGIFEDIDTMILGQLRGAKTLDLKVKDKDGNVVSEQNRENAFKTFYHENLGQIVTYTHFTGNGFDPVEFDTLEDGKYSLEFVANLGYGSSADESLTYDIYVDRLEPTVDKVETVDNKVKINVKDDNFILYSDVQLLKYEGTQFKPVGTLADRHTPYGTVSEHSIEIKNAEQLKFPYALLVTTLDAGYNQGQYLVSPEELVEVEDEAWVLEVSDTKQIEAQGHEFIDPTFTSADETIATVSESGEVTAHAVGETTIAVVDATGNYTVSVIVVDSSVFSFEASEYETRRNETSEFKLVYNGEELEADAVGLVLDYDTDSLDITAKTITAKKAGSHVVKATYTVSDGTRTSDEIYTAFTVVMVAELDKTALQLLVDNHTAASNTTYTQASVDALEAAVASAKVVLENESSTQAEIDEALNAITAAKAGLKHNVVGLEDSYTVAVGQSIQVTPSPVDGTWDYDPTLVKVERHLNGYKVTGLTVATTTLTFTNEDGESKTVAVTVTPKKDDGKDPFVPTDPTTDDKGQGTKKPGDKTDVSTGIEAKDSVNYIIVISVSLILLSSIVIYKRKQEN